MFFCLQHGRWEVFELRVSSMELMSLALLAFPATALYSRGYNLDGGLSDSENKLPRNSVGGFKKRPFGTPKLISQTN